MNTTPKFFICKHCGNIVEKVQDSGVPVICCGEAMNEMAANTTDAAREKHVPAVTVEGAVVHVQVGSVLHPMLEEHHIGWVWLQTEKGGQRCCLTAGMEPKAAFVLAEGDKPVAVYEWCNLHGLWKVDV